MLRVTPRECVPRVPTLLFPCLWAMLASSLGTGTAAAAPSVFHTSEYETPSRGNPGDLIMIAGSGFTGSDRVVYQAEATLGASREHPQEVPARSTRELGVARIVHVGSANDSLVVELPDLMTAHQPYRLWVVDRSGDWTEPLRINDPRPLWVTPAYLDATADVAGLGRRIRIVGRNLEPNPRTPMRIRLRGPTTYVLFAQPPTDNPNILPEFVADAPVPHAMVPGHYAIAVSRDGRAWTEIVDQRFEVRADPAALSRFALDDPRFGRCRPNDGAFDDACLTEAIDAAHRAGGGVIVVPPGTWDLHGDHSFVLPANVALVGAGPQLTVILRHDAKKSSPPGSLLVLTGRNSVTGIRFTDTDLYRSVAESRAVIQLGPVASGGASPPGAVSNVVSDIIISGNAFLRVGMALRDGGHPIARLYVTHNEFGAYYVALELPGNRYDVAEPYRIDDSVIRMNRFVPGSYVDASIRQGTIASELGAGFRLDFSNNVADGTATEALQTPADPKGWRAAFFWNMKASHVFELISENRISCSGDKAGDGEALSFDGNGNTYAFNGARPIAMANADSVTASGHLLDMQNDRPINRQTYYVGDWVQVVAGPGTGQVRKIVRYREDAATGSVTFEISPAWDLVPSRAGGRIIVGHEFREIYVLGNQIEQRNPPCNKANVSGPHGGRIGLWAPSADTVIAGNTQFDTDGIVFHQEYSAATATCRFCNNSSAFQSALEIRDNRIDGEYDWMSACSASGIMGSLAASPTPESPPPILGVGIVIDHNFIRHADGLGGGAIDITPTWFAGPRGTDWQLSRDLLIFGNTIRDIAGPRPPPACGYEQSRTGIRLGGARNVWDAVLYDNTCGNVDVRLQDSGRRTTHMCRGRGTTDCECSDRTREPR